MRVTVGKETELRCQVCQHDDFDERKAQLSKAGMDTWMSLWGLDWFNKPARCFVCVRCGYVHWFIPHESE